MLATSTKQVKYLKRGDWVMGPEPERAGQPQLLALVDGVRVDSDGMASVDTILMNQLFTARQNAENVVAVWANSDLPHRVKRDGEWPAMPGGPSVGQIVAAGDN